VWLWERRGQALCKEEDGRTNEALFGKESKEGEKVRRNGGSLTHLPEEHYKRWEF